MTASRTLRPRTWAALFSVAALIGTLAPSGAVALSEHSVYGFRVGASFSPDQITLGGYLAFDEISPQIRPRPSVDIGFGDNVLTIVGNGDFEYSFVGTSLDVLPYVGAGIALAYYNFDIPDLGLGVDDTQFEVGINLYGGFEKDLGGFKTGLLELRVGLLDIPDVKIAAGLGFF